MPLLGHSNASVSTATHLYHANHAISRKILSIDHKGGTNKQTHCVLTQCKVNRREAVAGSPSKRIVENATIKVIT